MGARAAAGESHDPRQLSAAEPLQKSSAGGRDIAQVVGDTSLVKRPHGVPAAGDAYELAAFGESGDLAGERESPLAEGRRLEGAERAIPKHGLDLTEATLQLGEAFGAEIENHAVERNFTHGAGLPIGALFELL